MHDSGRALKTRATCPMRQGKRSVRLRQLAIDVDGIVGICVAAEDGLVDGRHLAHPTSTSRRQAEAPAAQTCSVVFDACAAESGSPSVCFCQVATTAGLMNQSTLGSIHHLQHGLAQPVPSNAQTMKA